MAGCKKWSLLQGIFLRCSERKHCNTGREERFLQQLRRIQYVLSKVYDHYNMEQNGTQQKSESQCRGED